MSNPNPKLLNLDELELETSDITIRHEGEDHTMRILSVDMFLAQQKRARDHEKLVATGQVDDATDVAEDAVQVIRDAILEFFPTLPVGELATPKLFAIFAWLNELTAKLNEDAAGDLASESAEGNGLTLEGTTES